MKRLHRYPIGPSEGHGNRPDSRWSRRDFVRAGALATGGFAITLRDGFGIADLLRMQRIGAREVKQGVHANSPAAKACILIWLDGGPSHLETFDPKPEAPVEVRGPLSSIATSVPGIRLGECLPQTAALMDRVALIRSVTSPLGEHQFGTHYMMTGYQPTPVLDYPSYGAVYSFLDQKTSVLPKNVAVPQFNVGGAGMDGGGYLPPHHRPFSVGGDPAKPDFQVRDLNYFPSLTTDRIDRRMEFIESMNRFGQNSVEQESSQAQQETLGEIFTDSDPDLQRAYQLMTSSEAKSAFKIDEERDALRESYGRKTVGQSCLLARRLVERGVPFVTVNHKGWDTHNQLATRLKDGFAGAKTPIGLIPSLDRALSGLITDLEQRGMLDETLVVVMGEFGRTPKLNTSGGRDHWPRVFSVLMAGGGIRGGQVVGQSDSVGESPFDHPVTPSDLAATIYTQLGIDPTAELQTPDGRPVRLTPPEAEIIAELT